MSSKLPKNEKTDIDSLFLDTTLRPAKWEEYIGQDNIKNNLLLNHYFLGDAHTLRLEAYQVHSCCKCSNRAGNIIIASNN